MASAASNWMSDAQSRQPHRHTSAAADDEVQQFPTAGATTAPLADGSTAIAQTRWRQSEAHASQPQQSPLEQTHVADAQIGQQRPTATGQAFECVPQLRQAPSGNSQSTVAVRIPFQHPAGGQAIDAVSQLRQAASEHSQSGLSGLLQSIVTTRNSSQPGTVKQAYDDVCKASDALWRQAVPAAFLHSHQAAANSSAVDTVSEPHPASDWQPVLPGAAHLHQPALSRAAVNVVSQAQAAPMQQPLPPGDFRFNQPTLAQQAVEPILIRQDQQAGLRSAVGFSSKAKQHTGLQSAVESATKATQQVGPKPAMASDFRAKLQIELQTAVESTRMATQPMVHTPAVELTPQTAPQGGSSWAGVHPKATQRVTAKPAVRERSPGKQERYKMLRTAKAQDPVKICMAALRAALKEALKLLKSHTQVFTYVLLGSRLCMC